MLRREREAAAAVLNVGGGDRSVQQQALRVDQDVALLALDQLARIEPVPIDAAPLFRRSSRSPPTDFGDS